MGLTRKDQAARTRALIIKEAITLFARKGFAPTSIQDLAKAIGMTTGILYWHFEDKEALLIAVIEELERRLAEDLVRGGSQLEQAGPIETMEALIGRVAAQVEAHQENLLLVGVIGAEVTDTNPRVEKALRRAYDRFAGVAQSLMEQAQREGLIDPKADVECAAQMFIGMYMGGIMHQRLYRQTFPVARALPVLRSMLLASVVRRAESPPPRRRRRR